MRLAFDYTLDEMADTSLRAMRRSKSVQAIRSREIWTTAIVVAIAVFVAWNVSAGHWQEFDAGSQAIVIAVSIAIGALMFYIYRAYYDSTVRSRLLRITQEQFDKSLSHRCEIEVREDALWVHQDNIEILHEWKDREQIDDTGDAVELCFRNGIVVVRNRAFDSAQQRAEFVSLCRMA